MDAARRPVIAILRQLLLCALLQLVVAACFAQSETGSDLPVIDWSKVPSTIRPMPRGGFFPIPPTRQPGYYSLWEQLLHRPSPAAPKTGYNNLALLPFSYFDSDWRYVDTLQPEDRTWVENLKRLPVGEQSLMSVGGSYWLRFMNEHHSRLTQVTNDYTLERLRLFGDWSYQDSLRVYGEFLWADAFHEDLPPLVTDVNRGDILNLFADLKLFECDDKPVYLRAGRQELLYGSQRLLSPLEWGNTRRTFQGVKLFRQGEHWDLDAFWMQPVVPRASELDQADSRQNLVGAWATYRRKKGESLDFYYLGFDNRNAVTQQGIERAPATVHTTGSRWAGDASGFLWDLEAMLQFGEQAEQDLFAGAATAGLGRTWQETAGKPTVWAYYDYASGDANPGTGHAHTFNQLFPFGHYYMGWMDLVGRQNIHDVNLHGYLSSTLGHPVDSVSPFLARSKP